MKAGLFGQRCLRQSGFLFRAQNPQELPCSRHRPAMMRETAQTVNFCLCHSEQPRQLFVNVGVELPEMAADNPLDATLREYLNKHTENQVTLAAAIGRDRSWLNRYINGTGKASVDDVILMLAAFIHLKSGRGINEMLTGLERRLLRAFRALPDDGRRDDVIVSMEAVNKNRKQGPAPVRESTASTPHTPPAAARRAPGKQRRREG